MRPHWYEADALAAPFNSRAAFMEASLEINRDGLSRALEARWTGRADAPDPAVELDYQWPQRFTNLWDALRDAARRRLDFEGTQAVLRVDRIEPAREILRWRCVSLRIPTGLLIAAAAPPRVRPRPHVRVLPRGLAPPGPVALQHLHVMAAAPFEAVFTHVMSRRASFAPKEEIEPDGFERPEWLLLVSRARLARKVLDAASRGHMTDDNVERLTGGNRRFEALRDFARGQVCPFDRLTETGFWRLGGRAAGPKGDSVWAEDPLADGGEWPEGAFLARALSVAPEAGSMFQRLLVQYIRVKCILHNWLTHDPVRGGLAAFSRTFDRLGPYRAGLDEGTLAAFAQDEPELNLGSVEMRTSPPAAARTQYLARVARRRMAAGSTAGRIACELGWVFHVIRTLGQDRPWGARARDLRQSTTGLRTALTLDPTLLDVIRGVDVASQELRGELWLMVDTLRALRRVSQEASIRSGLDPLRLTLHAGEDFPHLVTGLRAVHEPYLWELMRRGDRLGHALALGTDPEAWVRCHTRVKVRRWVRILDITWLLDRLGEGCFKAAGSAIHRLERELDKLAEPLEVADGVSLVRLHESLGDRGTVDRCGDPYFRPRTSIENVLAHRLTAIPVRPDPWTRAFDEPVVVETGPELDLMVAARDWLAGLVSSWQTVVEVNPSSNLVIGQLGHPVDQPVFRLRPVDPAEREIVQVTINTDDPLTFATRLADEYAYAWAGMVVGGRVAPNYARQWLKESAEAGWASRFTLPAGART